MLNCGHMFCKECIEAWRKKKNECPIDRQPIQSIIQAPLAVKNMINKEKIRCINNKCNWSGELGNFIKHLENEC